MARAPGDDRAIADYDKVIEIEPDDFEAIAGRARAGESAKPAEESVDRRR